jgi:hypothetical protein
VNEFLKPEPKKNDFYISDEFDEVFLEVKKRAS